MAKTSTLYPELNFGLSEGCIEAGLKISSLETLSKMDFNCNLDGFLELDYTQRLQKLPMHFPRFASPHCRGAKQTAHFQFYEANEHFSTGQKQS